jgi:hypothetical protein
MAFERGNPGAILSTEMAGPSGPGKISPIVRKLLNYFIRGLIVVTPLAVTIWICVMIFQWIDDLLGFPIPGTGFVIMIVLVTMVCCIRRPRTCSTRSSARSAASTSRFSSR